MSFHPLVPKVQGLAAVGLSIIALGADKRPVREWAKNQEAAATPEELARAFNSSRVAGYGIVTGRVSGGVFGIDIDPDKRGKALEPVDTNQLLSEVLEVLSQFVDSSTLGIVRTPSGGYHIYLRCTYSAGNTKLAGVPANNRQGVHYTLETRHEGGYLVGPDSEGHGGTYELLCGDFANLPVLPQEQYKPLMAALRSLDRMPLEAAEEHRLARDYQQRQGEQSEVIRAFNEKHDPADILERNGYELVKGKYRSPDSTSGNAGVTVFRDAPLVYSHHGDALGDGRAHDAFDVFAILECDGDKKRAYREAAQESGLWQESAPMRRQPTPATAAQAQEHHAPAGEPTPPPDLFKYARSDYGNAERLVTQFGHTFRYCAPLGFLVWDGQRWKVDEGEATMRRLAALTGRELARQAVNLEGERRDVWTKHALGCDRAASIKNTVELAKTIPSVTVTVEELDANPMPLNVDGGTLDLRTGTLKPHDPADLITKFAPVTFNSSAKCPQWDEFQRTICAGDDDLIAFKQRAYGYSATGATSEHCLFIPYGTGANGKSTELDTIGALLGDYANVAQFDSFAVRKGESVRDDLADLMGARFVSASEGENRQRLAEGLIKQMTGGDTLKARRLYGTYFRFKPIFKLWLATNHKPVIRGVDEGIWRRIRLVPFAVTIPTHQRDRKLKEKLETERSGILNWVLEGCRLWLKDGLGEAEAVRAATESYRQESDVLAEFITARCTIDPLYSEVSGDLYKAYESWCRDNGEEPLNSTAFGRSLTDRGYAAALGRRGGKPVRLRNGLCLIEHATDRGEA